MSGINEPRMVEAMLMAMAFLMIYQLMRRLK